MKFLLAMTLILPTLAMAAGTTFLCVRETPRGAIALHLDPAGESIGRQSNPYTKDWKDLLGTDKDMWDKLNVGYVDVKGPDHITFNASVYGLTKHPQVIALTKSELKKDSLSFFIGDQKWMKMTCTKQKKALK